MSEPKERSCPQIDDAFSLSLQLPKPRDLFPRPVLTGESISSTRCLDCSHLDQPRGLSSIEGKTGGHGKAGVVVFIVKARDCVISVGLLGQLSFSTGNGGSDKVHQSVLGLHCCDTFRRVSASCEGNQDSRHFF